MLGHTTTAITADLYTHVLGNLKEEAADRPDVIFNEAETLRAAGAEQGARANCGSTREVKKKNADGIKRF